jgi:hypothetical protein
MTWLLMDSGIDVGGDVLGFKTGVANTAACREALFLMGKMDALHSALLRLCLI